VEDEQGAIASLEAMMDSFEPAYKEQWHTLSKDYKDRMLKGIKAFRLDVTRMQFKEKLSQNKKSFERSSIIEGLSRSEDSSEKTIANYMSSGLSRENPEDH
jgi:transcriptional regulator